MKQFTHQIHIATHGKGLYDFTRQIEDWLGEHPTQTGLLTVFCQHTSASLVIQENADPDVVADLADFMTRLVPEDTRLYRHTAEGPDDMTSHIRSALTQTQLVDSDSQRQAGAGDLAGRLFVRASRAAASAQRGSASARRLRLLEIKTRD